MRYLQPYDEDAGLDTTALRYRVKVGQLSVVTNDIRNLNGLNFFQPGTPGVSRTNDVGTATFTKLSSLEEAGLPPGRGFGDPAELYTRLALVDLKFNRDSPDGKAVVDLSKPVGMVSSVGIPGGGTVFFGTIGSVIPGGAPHPVGSHDEFYSFWYDERGEGKLFPGAVYDLTDPPIIFNGAVGGVETFTLTFIDHPDSGTTAAGNMATYFSGVNPRPDIRDQILGGLAGKLQGSNPFDHIPYYGIVDYQPARDIYDAFFRNWAATAGLEDLRRARTAASGQPEAAAPFVAELQRRRAAPGPLPATVLSLHRNPAGALSVRWNPVPPALAPFYQGTLQGRPAAGAAAWQALTPPDSGPDTYAIPGDGPDAILYRYAVTPLDPGLD